MFMNTIAVGPLEPVLSCVTGGTIVAIHLVDCHAGRASGAVCLERNDLGARLDRWLRGLRALIAYELQQSSN